MIGNGWVLIISNVHINATHPCSVNLEVSPGEKALLDAGVITEEDLIKAYREAIERGSFKHFNYRGS